MKKPQILFTVHTLIMIVLIQFANAQHCSCNCSLPNYGVKGKKCLSDCYRACELGWELKPIVVGKQNTEQKIDFINLPQLKATSIDSNSLTWQIGIIESTIKKNGETVLANGGCACSTGEYGCREYDIKCREYCNKICNK